MTPKTLTDVEELEVCARYRIGWTERQLADRFGVHRPTIQRCLDKFGVERRPAGLERRDDVDTSLIVRLRAEGYSWSKIARAVGMKPSGVRRRYDGAAGHILVTEPPETGGTDGK